MDLKGHVEQTTDFFVEPTKYLLKTESNN